MTIFFQAINSSYILYFFLKFSAIHFPYRNLTLGQGKVPGKILFPIDRYIAADLLIWCPSVFFFLKLV
ncbi:MAG: hypothetical protein CVU43_22155 [Chloroflexi bacterium HGW-Chloroflexi-5]|nr:MAG: hypothetical protein CVU54_12920 [Deltaproteobacteria bacterium HGW-Deltaproteobacteria-12]PKN96155.1 MAG: hypothetical protein CVU43_22155 [Chloroflexi bacterium HGW-Chloroflexi-5]